MRFDAVSPYRDKIRNKKK